MTVNVEVPSFAQPPLKKTAGNKMATTNYLTRIPLQPRPLQPASATGSMSSSADDYPTKDLNGFHRTYTSESSGHENNQRISFLGSQSRRGNSIARQNDNDEMMARPISVVNAGRSSSDRGVSSARSGSVERPGRSAAPGQRHARSASLNPVSRKAETDENVVIEEKRRNVDGPGYTLHRYLRGRLLGRGGFAKVYLCTALDTGKNYAVKIVPKANLVKARARQKLQAEIKIHRTLKHGNVCQYKHFFEDRDNCYILLELCHNQSLNELIKRRKRLTEPEAAYYMRQLMEAVRYLHDNLVIHRDLKLGNLFLDKGLNVKVGDLGLATRLATKDEKRKTICGTPNYIAPEVIQGDKQTRGHSFEVDIWSMGVILFTILVGKPPYEAKDVKATYQRILANQYSFPDHIQISSSAKNLIVSMLQSKPEQRPSIDQIASHPFLKDKSVPVSLPSNATHVAPEWRMNSYGELVAESQQATMKKAVPPSGMPPARRPFGQRDPNMAPVPDRKNHEFQKDVKDVRGMVRNALGGIPTSNKPIAKSNFQIFDESEATAQYQSRPPQPVRPTSITEELVARTNALTVRTGRTSPDLMKQSSSSPLSALETPRSTEEPIAAPVSTRSNSESDARILQRMLGNLESVMEITNARKGTYRSFTMKPVRGGPTKWVTRYVDYTSKYGLGFLLNDGSSGVYFNDSTKTVLEIAGEKFQYIERRRVEDVEPQGASREPLVSSHTLSDYPAALQKKVTLLKHFHNYLIDQQKKSDGECYSPVSDTPEAAAFSFVFIKKWVRTKHAILFRLSNQTVQIVFYDQTEILLTPDERFITYVDKFRKRQTFHFNDELVGSNMDLAKRLKYTKEIMQQLMSGKKQ